MTWLLRDNWLGSLVAFLLGATITWRLLNRPSPSPVHPTSPEAANPTGQEPPAQPTPATREAPAQPGPTGRETPAQPTHADAPGTRTPPAGAGSAAPTPAGSPARPPAATPAPEAPARPAVPEEPAFSQLMDGEATLFDHIEEEKAAVPVGRYGEGSADAVPHQGPPDGFTIKGNAQSMLFHTPDSPYYGRTKPEVWFRTEADAERAGFTKYVRRPRKSTDPRT